jgi:hypothetical protein
MQLIIDKVLRGIRKKGHQPDVFGGTAVDGLETGSKGHTTL